MKRSLNGEYQNYTQRGHIMPVGHDMTVGIIYATMLGLTEFRYAILPELYSMLTHPRLSSIVRQLLQRSPAPETIRVVMGELTLNESDLREQWKSLVSSTPLENTMLTFRIIRAEQQCMVCFLVYHPNEKETACPQCKSVGAKILKGEEFYFELD